VTSGGPWRIELTRAAIDGLRALSREDKELIARRIDHLAEHGLPPSARERAGVTGGVELPVDGHLLVCVEDPAAGKLYVLGLRSERTSLGQTVRHLMHQAAPRWLREWMRGGGDITMGQDIRFAARSLARSPGFTAVAVLTLALGIGATAAIFSVANGVLLKSLPYDRPEEVVTLWTSWDNFPDKTWVSIPEYQLFHQENRTLEDLALYGGGRTSFTSVESPEQVGAAAITPNTLDVLGVAPLYGRVFTWEEAETQVPVVLLAYDTWQRRYGGSPSIVGTDVELDGSLQTILGILPQGFALPTDFASSTPAEVFYPFFVDLESPAPDLGTGGSHGWYGVGRLNDGVTLEEARSDFSRIMAQVEPRGLYSAERRFTPKLFAAKSDVVGTARRAILVLFGAVALVLLIACGNVANLLLSRSEVRMREVAVRTALGAGRTVVLRQLFVESLLLAGVAGILGVALATLGVDALLAIDPDAVPRSTNVELNATVLGFTLLLSVATALLFGGVPALRVTRAGVAETLHEGGRGGSASRSSNRMQRFLVASQMAMAVILLTGSALMIKTFVELLRIDPGFGADHVLTVRVSTPAASYPDPESIIGFYDELMRRVREIPGVHSAGAARLLPLASTIGDSFLRPVGYEPGPNEGTQGDWQWAIPGYFETMGIPLIEGRTFDERDRRDGQAVVIINAVVARRYWGDESPLGRAMLAGGAADTAVVVGVVGNVSHNGLTGEVKTRYYVPHAQVHPDWIGSMRSMTLTIATEGPPRGYVEAVRREVRALDPSIPLAEVRTLDEVLSTAVAQPRFAMVLLGSFAAIALALALVGIYGVLAYAVSRRTREIGIRMALGAEAGRVTGMVIRQGMTMAIAGVLIGTGIAWFMTDLMAGLLYAVSPQDTATFAAVPAVFAVVALVACWIPAARAARVRPSTALRYE
jgi:putative ABC transport system permease protein